MRNDDCRLRPIEERDLKQVLDWRNSERVRMNMYTDQPIQWADHVAWFQRHLQNDTSYAFIFELQGQPIGVVNFTVKLRHGLCEWGFYRGAEVAPRGAAGWMGLAGLDYAFDVLQVRKVIGEVIAFNAGSLRYHERLGFKQEGRLIQQVLKNEQPEDVVVFGLLKRQWLLHRNELIHSLSGGSHEGH